MGVLDEFVGVEEPLHVGARGISAYAAGVAERAGVVTIRGSWVYLTPAGREVVDAIAMASGWGR